MPAITVTLNFKAPEFNSLDLPIEIRRPDSSLVTRTLPSKPVEVPPGRYYVTARLPGGQRLVQTITVDAEPATIALSPNPEDESPHEWEAVSHYLERPSRPRAVVTPQPRSPLADFTRERPQSLQAKVRVFAGNAVTRTLTPQRAAGCLALVNFVRGRVVQFKVSSGPLIVQLVEPGAPAQNMVIPAGGASDAQLVFTRRDDATCAMEAHLHEPIADLMLRFAGTTDVIEADEVIRSTVLDAERLAASKDSDPIAAAVAAYAMLRFGKIAELHDWTANLYEWFTWLPDGVAIRGEHLARLGKHREAEAIFSELPARGLPIVADGFFYVVERLKLYSKLLPDKAQGVNVTRAGTVLAQLERFAPFIHRKRPIVSYTGLDPANPTLETAQAMLTDPLALDLATWLDDSVSMNP